MKRIWLGAMIALLFGTQAMAQDEAPQRHESDKGEVLANAKGMTLYVFDKDRSGKSVCNGACATAWPPLQASPSSVGIGGFAVISRDDGSAQWSYKGRPLYTWIKDQKPGDTTGDGFLNGAWHIAKP